METLTLKLTKPLKNLANGAEIGELELREPTAKELAEAANEANGYFGDIALISAVAKLPKIVVEQMGAFDFTAASSFLGGFARRGLATGASLPQTSPGSTAAP